MDGNSSTPETPAAFDEMVRRVADDRERITMTEGGRTAAVLINPEDLADLEEALAVARYQMRKAAGTIQTIPHTEVRRILGLERP